jgi:hypothetical protein
MDKNYRRSFALVYVVQSDAVADVGGLNCRRSSLRLRKAARNQKQCSSDCKNSRTL